MLEVFTFTVTRTVEALEVIHALRVRATCREVCHIISPAKVSAIAFALTRKGFAYSGTVGTWLRVWEACAEAVETHGYDASAWADGMYSCACQSSRMMMMMIWILTV